MPSLLLSLFLALTGYSDKFSNIAKINNLILKKMHFGAPILLIETINIVKIGGTVSYHFHAHLFSFINRCIDNRRKVSPLFCVNTMQY